MSEKIQRYHINERCIVVPNRFGALCQSSDVSALESRLAEAEKDRDALSARVRELEGALGPFIEPNVDLIGEPGTVGSVVTLEQFARAARALKGTT